MATSDEHPFDIATENVKEVNAMLADTDGAIAAMSFDGAVGYHHYVAAGETDPEYLWRTAFLKALDDTVLEMAYVDADHPEDARHQLERHLGDYFDPLTAEYVADEFEQNLKRLQESHQEIQEEEEDV